MTDELWVKRRYLPDDEPCVVSMWLKSYAHSPGKVSAGANKDGSPAELVYWDAHAPVVEHLLKTAETWVLCDPERSEYTDDSQAVIHAFACFGPGDCVHFACVKRSMADKIDHATNKVLTQGFGREMLADLFGDRLTSPQLATHNITDMWHNDKTGRPPQSGVVMPRQWIKQEVFGDPFALLRSLLPVSERREAMRARKFVQARPRASSGQQSP